MGVINMNEQEFPDRFSDGDAWTMVRNRITLPFKKNTLSIPGTAIPASTAAYAVNLSGAMYLFCGVVVKKITVASGVPTAYYLNTVTPAWVTTGGTEYALPVACNSTPKVFKGNIYIPCTTQLIRLNDAGTLFENVTDGGSNVAASYLEIFDEDLLILKNTGAFVSTDTDSTTLTTVNRGALDTFEYLNGMITHRNQLGAPAVWISTESGLFVLDYFAGIIYPAGISFPDKDRYSGQGLTVWDGDLWFGRGANAHQVVNGARIVRGPNNGDGLVRTRLGRITNFNSGFDNYLAASLDTQSATDQESSIALYNRKGWHTLAVFPYTAASSVFSDTFTRADSATTMGSDWLPIVGHASPIVMGISSNQAYHASGGSISGPDANGTVITNSTTLGADRSIQATFITRSVAAGYYEPCLYFRGDGTFSNWWRVRSTYAASSAYKLESCTAGTITTVATFGSAYAGDIVRVDATGSSISVYINGVLAYNTTSSTHSTLTYHGIGNTSISAQNDRFDSFSISTFTTYSTTSLLHNIPSGSITVPSLLFYNNSSTIYYSKVFDLTDNPEQFISSDFNSGGSLTLPKFDANLSKVQKTALSIQIRVLDASATETVKVLYALDDSTTFTYAYTSAGASLNTSPIITSGVSTIYLDTDKLGTLFYNIRLKVELASGSVTASPKVVFISFRYLRELEVLYTYSFVVDLTSPQPDQVYPDAALDNLRTAMESRLLVPFAFHSGKSDDTKYGIISGYSGPIGSGPVRSGTARLTILEVTPQ
mgnify:FL=1